MKAVVPVLLANACLGAVALLFIVTQGEPLGQPASAPLVESTFTVG